MRCEVIGSCALYLGDMREAVQGVHDAHSCVTDPPYHLTSIVKRFGAKNAAAPKSDGPTGVYKRSAAGFMGQEWDGGDISFRPETWEAVMAALRPGGHLAAFAGTRTYHRIACAIEAAGFEIRDMLSWVYGSGFPKSHNLKDEEWQGWGTALKPALEPIAFARKSLIGSVAENVSEHETGAINIDACRIESQDGQLAQKYASVRNAPPRENNIFGADHRSRADGRLVPHANGRWPANVITDGSMEVYASFPRGMREAIRFFYAAKASKREREAGLVPPEGGKRANTHPTVKPVTLMQWLCRLTTPSGGLVLDPFMGSGSTGMACVYEGFRFIGIEKDEAYFDIAARRIEAAVKEVEAGLFSSEEMTP